LYKGYPVCALYSGGKDSTYALHWAFLKGFNVKCLVTLKPRTAESWMFHYPAVDVTELQAKALGLPQVFEHTEGRRGSELEDLKRALRKAAEKYGIKGVVTGALLSDYQRMNINFIAEELGLKVYSPLWRKDQAAYLRELVEEGFEFILTSITVWGLPPTLLGKVVTMEDVEKIIELADRYGFNPAFEGGEAETLVVYAPLFKSRIKVEGRRVRLGEYEWRFEVTRAWLEGS